MLIASLARPARPVDPRSTPTGPAGGGRPAHRPAQPPRDRGVPARRAERRPPARAVPVACSSLDVDHFKSFNDRLGHRSGDARARARRPGPGRRPARRGRDRPLGRRGVPGRPARHRRGRRAARHRPPPRGAGRRPARRGPRARAGGDGHDRDRRVAPRGDGRPREPRRPRPVPSARPPAATPCVSTVMAAATDLPECVERSPAPRWLAARLRSAARCRRSVGRGRRIGTRPAPLRSRGSPFANLLDHQRKEVVRLSESPCGTLEVSGR